MVLSSTMGGRTGEDSDGLVARILGGPEDQALVVVVWGTPDVFDKVQL